MSRPVTSDAGAASSSNSVSGQTRLCPKCGERPKPENQRWCSPCRKGRTAGERSPGGEQENGRHDHSACHRELEMLRLDVERLKGELGQARMAAEGLRPANTVREVVAKMDSSKQVVAHSESCQCWGCRAGRVRGR